MALVAEYELENGTVLLDRGSTEPPIIKSEARKSEPEVIWQDDHIMVLRKEAGWVCAISHVLEENQHHHFELTDAPSI